MAYGVTPIQAELIAGQPLRILDKYGMSNHHWPTFTATDLDSTLRAATRALDCRSMSGLRLKVKNIPVADGGNVLTAFKIYSGEGLDANGALANLSANPSDLMDAAFARTNSVDPTTLAADTEMDIVIDMNPMPPYVQPMAAAADGAKTNLIITVVGARP
jgi:hypothetical protein